MKVAFVKQLLWARSTMEFALMAWVIMPEHVHLLIMPRPPELTVTRILQTLKRRSAAQGLEILRDTAAALPVDAHGKTRFWQKGGGYDRNIVTRDELQEKVRYTHQNPVRRGLVAREIDWEWSSARAWQGLETPWPDLDTF